MIHVERAKMVLDAIQSHKNQFRFDVYFGFANPEVDQSLEEQMKCGTAGCIAGWTLTIFTPKTNIYEALTHCPGNAAQLLNLTDDESWFLFMFASDYANIDDAVMRLEWLIDGKNWNDYNCKNESWNFRKDVSEDTIEKLHKVFYE